MTAPGKLEQGAWMLGGLGLLGAAIGWAVEPRVFYGGWLSAITFFLGWPLGSMALLLVHALTGGRWGDALRPALLIGTLSLPALVPALLPWLLGLPALYAWAWPDQAVGLANHAYLNLPFFAGRGCFYLVTWFGLAALLWRGAEGGITWRRMAPAGLFLLAISVTFAAVDGTMSLDPRYCSSVYGMVTGAGMALLALSVAVLLSAGAPAEASGASPGARGDFGRLILALVVLWTYLDFMQLLIVWQSNLAREAPWYLARSRGEWGAVRIAVATGHFVLPFFLLLSSRMQKRRGVVLGVAALLVAMEAVRSWWIVLPSLGRGLSWIDPFCMAGLGGLACGCALWAARRPALARRIGGHVGRGGAHV